MSASVSSRLFVCKFIPCFILCAGVCSNNLVEFRVLRRSAKWMRLCRFIFRKNSIHRERLFAEFHRIFHASKTTHLFGNRKYSWCTHQWGCLWGNCTTNTCITYTLEHQIIWREFFPLQFRVIYALIVCTKYPSQKRKDRIVPLFTVRMIHFSISTAKKLIYRFHFLCVFVCVSQSLNPSVDCLRIIYNSIQDKLKTRETE